MLFNMMWCVPLLQPARLARVTRVVNTATEFALCIGSRRRRTRRRSKEQAGFAAAAAAVVVVVVVVVVALYHCRGPARCHSRARQRDSQIIVPGLCINLQLVAERMHCGVMRRPARRRAEVRRWCSLHFKAARGWCKSLLHPTGENSQLNGTEQPLRC